MGETAPYARLRENLAEVMRLGRAVGVNLIVSSLRPIGDHIPVQVRKNCSTRIGTKVEEDSEYDYLFGYQRGLRARNLKTKGEAYFFRGDEDGYSTVRKIKVFHLKPSRIADVCRATAHLRPALDARGQEVANREFTLYGETVRNVYATRWERLDPWLRRLALGGGNPLKALAEAVEAGTVQADDKTREALGQALALDRKDAAVKPPASTEEALARYQAARRRVQDEEINKRVLGADEETVERMFAGLVADLEPPPPPAMEPPRTVPLDERLALVAKIVRAAGDGGIMRRDIIAAVKAAGVEVTDQTVSDWLKAALERKLVRQGSKQGQWIPGEAA
jgi:hypothetical protein